MKRNEWKKCCRQKWLLCRGLERDGLQWMEGCEAQATAERNKSRHDTNLCRRNGIRMSLHHLERERYARAWESITNAFLKKLITHKISREIVRRLTDLSKQLRFLSNAGGRAKSVWLALCLIHFWFGALTRPALDCQSSLASLYHVFGYARLTATKWHFANLLILARNGRQHKACCVARNIHECRHASNYVCKEIIFIHNSDTFDIAPAARMRARRNGGSSRFTVWQLDCKYQRHFSHYIRWSDYIRGWRARRRERTHKKPLKHFLKIFTFE